jgi:hypothetical protein
MKTFQLKLQSFLPQPFINGIIFVPGSFGSIHTLFEQMLELKYINLRRDYIKNVDKIQRKD